MKRYFLTVLIVTVLLGLAGENVSACWCRHDPEETNTPEKFSRYIAHLAGSADFVFSGTLIEKNNEQLVFRIKSNWKNAAHDKITFSRLHNVDKNGERKYFIDNCAFFFEPGKSYLVYAFTTLEGFDVSKCGRTTDVENAGRDIEELNRQKQSPIAGATGHDSLLYSSQL